MQYLNAILPLFSALLYLCLGVTIYFLSKDSFRKVYLRFCIITFHWQFSWAVLFLWNSDQYSDLICKIGYSGIIFLPVSCYEIVIHYLELPKRHLQWFYYLCWGFLASLWSTNLFIKGAYSQAFGYYPEAGIIHIAYMIMVGTLMVRLFSILYRVYRDATDTIKKNQLKFFFITSIIFSLSAIDYFLNYPAFVQKVNIQLYPIGVFFLSFSVLVFILAHFITLNLTLEKRVAMKTAQLEASIVELEEVARYKKNFIANITHELRTPLTLIRGWTDFIRDGKLGKIPTQLGEVIDKIGVQTLNLTVKINELLKVTKFDAGMAKVVLAETDINMEIYQIVSSFKGLTDQRGVKLNYFGSPDIEFLFIDREKLKDILNNLIRNAYKFTESGEIKVILNKQNDRIIIKVEDTGVGMTSQMLEQMFQRFRQGDGSKTRKYEGTGLGLSIVKESVELMSGRVYAESIAGKGTSFSVVLPADLDKRMPDVVMERRVKERRKLIEECGIEDRRRKDRRLSDLAKINSDDIARILDSEISFSPEADIKKISAKNSRGVIVIAEDNIGIQEFLSIALKGYTLFIASNGQSAWQAIKEKKPGLVISDVMMPVMDGHSLLKKIRKHKKTKSIPVIIITSLTGRDERIKSLQLGADDYLTKPFHHLELQARVKNVLSVHRLEREKTKSEQLEIFLMVMASVIESKDPYTGGHVERVAGYARALARKLKLNEAVVHDIYLGTIVHDVGKIGIKDEILNKPGKLTDQEFDRIKEHPAIGKALLSKLEITPVAVNIVYSHQEKWDGTGYPDGLSKKNIPIEARVATIVDFWDAITSDRPYRKAMSLEKAISIMHEERGKSFDPELLDIFMDDRNKMYLKYINLNKYS